MVIIKKLIFTTFLYTAVIVTCFGFEHLFSFRAEAQQISASLSATPIPVLTQSVLFDKTATTSVQSDLPMITNIEKSFQTPTPATNAAVTQTTEDYCIEMPVIMYHHIQPMQLAELLGHGPLTVDSDMFDNHVKYLKDHNYTAISTEDLINALYNRLPLPEKSVMITIDDGYDDNYTYAFMTAKKYQMIMNFMIPTGLINKPGYMNWDHLMEMKNSPYARIYNHTTNHAALGTIPQESILQEVSTANNDLQTKLGIFNTIVIYPYGSYNDLAIESIKKLGMRGAVSTDPGRNECLSNIMKLPRVRVGNAPLETYGF